MGTKLYPSKASPHPESRYTLKAADVRRGLMDSLKALKTDKIDLFYLHGPDREVPFEETLREVNKLHNEGLFNRFGISNFLSWEVAAMCQICEQNGWIKPTVYQSIYNAIHRNIEAEFFPCLRYYGISLYSFQPLASGFLTSHYQRNQTEFEPGSRFDTSTFLGKATTARYWNNAYFDTLDVMRPVMKKHGLTEAEYAMRWLSHHSEMKLEAGDAVIIGASNIEHAKENLVDLEKGPLPEDVVEAMNEAWMKVKAVSPKYWH